MAIFLARGGRSFTTCPPMRTSPEVWVSSPAIIRSRGVFPQPAGPRKTRNSPSLTDRSTPSTAFTSPKCFLMFLVSTVAMDDLSSPVRMVAKRQQGMDRAQGSVASQLDNHLRRRGTLACPGGRVGECPPLCRSIIATGGSPASDHFSLFPFVPDALARGFRLLERLLGGFRADGRLGEHRVQNPRAEDLADRRVRVSRVPDVRRPVQHVRENRVLVGRV